ncbi:MAG: PilX N-terminal domain-containing pilus assembly protein [Aquisalimonadaceae bacterium]
MPHPHTRTARHPAPSGQRGVALVLSLVILLVLTLISVTAMRGSILEERMAGGLQDHNRAFQAAEAALRDAERYLQSATLDPFDNNNGLYALNAANRPAWATPVSAAATDGGVITYANSRPGAGSQAPAIPGVAAQPQYLIEVFPPVPSPGGSLEAGVPLDDLEQYRVTARGFGGNASSVVILQSTYRR